MSKLVFMNLYVLSAWYMSTQKALVSSGYFGSRKFVMVCTVGYGVSVKFEVDTGVELLTILLVI